MTATSCHPLTKAERFCRKFGIFFHHKPTLWVECVWSEVYISRVKKHSLPNTYIYTYFNNIWRLYHRMCLQSSSTVLYLPVIVSNLYMLANGMIILMLLMSLTPKPTAAQNPLHVLYHKQLRPKKSITDPQQQVVLDLPQGHSKYSLPLCLIRATGELSCPQKTDNANGWHQILTMLHGRGSCTD